MTRYFVKFFYRGSFVSEESIHPIKCWHPQIAWSMAAALDHRAYAFRFITKVRGEDDLDSRETDQSGTYYLGGEVFTVDAIKARNDPDDSILISNMECNKWEWVIRTSTGIFLPFSIKDTLLPPLPPL